MRKNYPILSAELNDIFQDCYAKLVYVIGYDDEDGTEKYPGTFDGYDTIIRDQINVIHQMIYDNLANKTEPLNRTWGRHIERNSLRRL